VDAPDPATEPTRTGPVVDEQSALSSEPGAGDFAEIARHTTGYVKAWTRLVSSEAAVAKANVTSILIGALLVPALAFATVMALDAVIAALLFELLHDWFFSILAVLLLDVGVLIGLLLLLRGWWRTLSLPRSREALTRLWRDDGNASDQRKGTPARSAA